LIREWQADIVLSHRPNDYHPDHRYTGVLVQDASFMVTVPYICSDVPHLKKNPLFLYYSDRFERPNPFRADMIVGIDDVLDKKLAALDVMESQFFERGVEGSSEQLIKDSATREDRRKQVRQGFMGRDNAVAQKYRDKLAEYYGKEAAAKIGHAEAFEICEYGGKPTPAELKTLFPFYDKASK
jgi:LmbE family N-acetylglucosaminyl deacetylase